MKVDSVSTGKYIVQTFHEQTWQNYSSADSLEEALILASSIEKYDESCPEEKIRILTPDGQIL